MLSTYRLSCDGVVSPVGDRLLGEKETLKEGMGTWGLGNDWIGVLCGVVVCFALTWVTNRLFGHETAWRRPSESISKHRTGEAVSCVRVSWPPDGLPTEVSKLVYVFLTLTDIACLSVLSRAHCSSVAETMIWRRWADTVFHRHGVNFPRAERSYVVQGHVFRPQVLFADDPRSRFQLKAEIYRELGRLAMHFVRQHRPKEDHRGGPVGVDMGEDADIYEDNVGEERQQDPDPRRNLDPDVTFSISPTGEDASRDPDTLLCWVAIHGRAYDLSSFVSDHPGGQAILWDYAGKDASKAFDLAYHSQPAFKAMAQYLAFDPRRWQGEPRKRFSVVR